jgi:thioredoxin 1
MMVIERLLVTILLGGLGVAIFLVFRSWHLHQVQKETITPAVQTDGPVIMYFRSDSCAPCRTQNQYLTDLEESYGARMAIQKIDVDDNKEMAGRFGVFTLPTTLVLDRAGKVHYINYGLTATNKLARQMEKVI